jgi:hypothetical protein
MVEHCMAKGYQYSIVSEGLDNTGRRIPFVTPAVKHYAHILACRRFLKTERPSKIILTKSVPPHHTILKEANRLGVETIVLQWALSGAKELYAERAPRPPSVHLKIYYALVDVLRKFIDVILGGLPYAFSRAVPKKAGVIDDYAKQLFEKRYGFNPKTTRAVGMVDFQVVHELKQRIVSDGVFRKKLEERYNLSAKKRRILVLSWHFHRKKSSNITTEEQIAYFYDVMRMIREVFPQEGTSVLMKLHPSDEPQLYESYKQLGVSVFADEASTEELICLSDLVIVDPWTSANYMVLASNVAAIFINFSHMKLLNEGMKYFNIKHTVVDKAEFIEKLRQFKEGRLDKQYNNDFINVTSVDNIRALIDEIW